MTDKLDFAGMIPGLDFLQSLVKGAGASLSAGVPNMGQWVAPTLDPEALDKRIQELRTVQFWLEQNSKLLGATIQAMEVQRMTLATLRTMNLPMAGLRDALSIKTPAPEPAAAAVPEHKAAQAADEVPGNKSPAAIDPMQWWGALTQQFTDIANKTLSASAAAPLTAATAAQAKPTPAAAASKKAARKSTGGTRGSSGTSVPLGSARRRAGR